jgi:hypothetical protein
MASAIALAAAGLTLLAAGFWLLVRPAIRHRPHHAAGGPLPDRTYPLA